MARQWKIGEAKQSLSEVVRRAGEEPQLLFNRDELVAAVIDGETWKVFEEWLAAQGTSSLGGQFESLRAIAAQEGYSVPVPARRSRRDSFSDVLDDLSD